MTDKQKEPILAAVCAVMADVKRLDKAGRNKFANYDYVTVDDVMDFIRPLMAKHGLSMRMNQSSWTLREVTNSKGELTVCAVFEFEIILRHDGGVEDEPDIITIMLPYTGAQTTGAAQRYAQKEWAKVRFMLSTGEEKDIEAGDADSLEQQDYKTAGKTQVSKDDAARKAYEELQIEVRGLMTVDEADRWVNIRRTQLNKLPPDWTEHLRREWKERVDEIKKETV